MAGKSFSIEYRGRDDGFASATNRVSAQLRSLGREVNGLAGKELGQLQQRLAGLFTVDFLSGKIEQAIQFADSMRALSDMTQIGVESLQEMEFAAKQAGTPFEAIISAIRNLERSRVSALGGNKGDLASFDRLGTSLESLKQSSGEVLFRQIAAAIHDGSYSAQQLNDMLNLMGRSASQLFPLFNAGFEEMTAKAKELGVVMSEDLINALDEAGDQMDEMNARFRHGFGMIGSAIAGVWNYIARRIEVVTGAIVAFGAAWNVQKGLLDNLVETTGWMSAKQAYPSAMASAFKDAFKAIEGDWARLKDQMDSGSASKGKANDQAEFAAERAQKAAALMAENDKKQERLTLKSMSAQDRINELLEKRVALLGQISAATDELSKQELRTKLIALDEDILSTRTELARPEKSFGKLVDRNLDDLSRSGFFTGGSPSELITIAREQLAEIEKTVVLLRTLPENLGRNI